LIIYAKGDPSDFVFGIYSKRNNWVGANHHMQGSQVITGNLYFDHDIIEHNGELQRRCER
jgi:hypothetical protein